MKTSEILLEIFQIQAIFKALEARKSRGITKLVKRGLLHTNAIIEAIDRMSEGEDA